MTMQRYLLYMASLAVCALLLLSACGGPTPIAGRVTETVTPASPTTGVSPSPAATATETPPTPPPATATPTPPATDTPAPDDAKPAKSTETPVANIKPPEISGYLLEQGSDGGWVYKDQKENIVARIVTYNEGQSSTTKTKLRRAIVVSSEKLMATLLETEGKDPLPFNPKGLNIHEQRISGYTVIAILGPIQQVVQPFPGSSARVILNRYADSSAAIAFFPHRDDISGFTVTASSFTSSLTSFRESRVPFGAVLGTNFSSDALPNRYQLGSDQAVITGRGPKGVSSVFLNDFASFGGFTVAADYWR